MIIFWLYLYDKDQPIPRIETILGIIAEGLIEIGALIYSIKFIAGL